MSGKNLSPSSLDANLEKQAGIVPVAPEENLMKPPSFTVESIKNYCVTRVTTLVPTKEYVHANKNLLNPIPALRDISGKQWLFILCAFMGWTWDAFDFFTISLNVNQLSKDLNRTTTDITWAITLVLMLRTVGAFIFGYFGDRYGTKWPFIVNLLLMMVIQIGCSFIETFKQFLGVRALFGIVMGGIYGNATATALDDCPPRSRGFISGFLQQGYAFGYLLAVIFTRALADTQKHQWRAVYWFAACVTLIIAISRAMLPETNAFLQKQAIKRYQMEAGIVPESFGSKVKKALKIYWLMTIYMVLLMAGFNFMSHGSQDLFPTFLTEQLGFSKDRSTVTNCVANIGAIVGGLIVGHFSNFIGRRLSIMICCVGGGALIYPWGFVRNDGINAAVFFLQFFVQGAFGVIPAHLSELAHPDFKAFTVGLAYQLGNLASSASSTIESQLGAQFPIVNEKGETIHDYGKVMAIFMGCVFAYNLVMSFIGPENMNISEELNEADPAAVLDTTLTDKASQERVENASIVHVGKDYK
ncbi:hypothetical protein C7M61_000631 [Candidozyma pseudohaemuli]|uniref:Major facilitator superfamily (MFS) profile domain-containing protein n=1 Tax=Candidozyma pseudohaemuli TaxID=418784 RepID=A0A2P7YYD7_9ASCO|nr:hypothetical protein C7M61_000631 [[Candida] pseudohaemulonii]PSK40964.1 hypothetical protein C7M61_000631 [[Candida] pseudohaemulonii]